MAHIKTVMAEAIAQVQGGKTLEQRIADGGYSVRVQRTARWNSRTARIVIHVWHQAEPGQKSRLLSKAEWAQLIA